MVVEPYIPLDRLDVEGNFLDQINNFVLLENIPKDILLTNDRIILILDGLDELIALGQSAKDLADKFIQKMQKSVEQRNANGGHILVLLTGRDMAIQDIEGLFLGQQVLNILPLYNYQLDKLTNKKCFIFNNGKYLSYKTTNKLVRDKRTEWWSRYTIAIKNHEEEIPEELLESDLEELSIQPLLLHLLAICFIDNGVLPENKAKLYNILLNGVFNRAPIGTGIVNRHTLSRYFDSVDEFIDIMSDIAIAMWHSNTRQVTLDVVKKYCDNFGHDKILAKLGDISGIASGIKLLMVFYSRRTGYIGDMESFEFTHKSFSEYLVARHIVKTFKKMSDRINYKDYYEGDADKHELEIWGNLCGESCLDMDTIGLIEDEIALCSSVVIHT